MDKLSDSRSTQRAKEKGKQEGMENPLSGHVVPTSRTMADSHLTRGWCGNRKMACLEGFQSLKMRAPFLLLEVWSQKAHSFGPWRAFECWQILWPPPGCYIAHPFWQWWFTMKGHSLDCRWGWLLQYYLHVRIIGAEVSSYCIPHPLWYLKSQYSLKEMYIENTTTGKICCFPSPGKKNHVTEATLYSDKNVGFKFQPDTSWVQ